MARPFEHTKAGRFAADTLRATRGLIHSFRGDSITLRAGNLTFITITSLLPLLAVVLALLHWAKQQQFEHMVFNFIQEVLAPGAHRDTDDYVKRSSPRRARARPTGSRSPSCSSRRAYCCGASTCR